MLISIDFEDKLVVTHSSCLIDEKFLKKYTNKRQNNKEQKNIQKAKEAKEKIIGQKLPERSKKYKLSNSSGGISFDFII